MCMYPYQDNEMYMIVCAGIVCTKLCTNICICNIHHIEDMYREYVVCTECCTVCAGVPNYV